MKVLIPPVRRPRFLITASLAAVLAALAASPPASAQSIPTGLYECTYFGRLVYSFTIMSGGRYRGEQDSGSYSFSGGVVAFHGGFMDGQRGQYRPGPPPTIGIMGTGGRETESCQLSR